MSDIPKQEVDPEVDPKPKQVSFAVKGRHGTQVFAVKSYSDKAEDQDVDADGTVPASVLNTPADNNTEPSETGAPESQGELDTTAEGPRSRRSPLAER
jgi:hypothetical protein